MAHHTIKKGYTHLADRINKFPQGAPPTKLLFKILEMLVSEKEASLISLLPIKPFNAKKAIIGNVMEAITKERRELSQQLQTIREERKFPNDRKFTTGDIVLLHVPSVAELKTSSQKFAQKWIVICTLLSFSHHFALLHLPVQYKFSGWEIGILIQGLQVSGSSAKYMI